MDRELVWLILPVVGLLSQLGGTFNKIIRRLGVPTIITLAYLTFLGWSWWLPVLFIAVYGVATMPFTLVGEGLGASWINYLWIWVSGYLLGLPCVLIAPTASQGLLWAIVPCLVQGIFGTLSNVKATAKYFPWKCVEFSVWASMAYCYALAIQLRVMT